MKKRNVAALLCAAMLLAGCGPQEEVDAHLQRVVLDIPFGPVQPIDAQVQDEQP